jgi:hypothetical protein
MVMTGNQASDRLQLRRKNDALGRRCEPDRPQTYPFLLSVGCLDAARAISSAGPITGKSLVIIAISALRASALAIFSVKWFKLKVVRDAKSFQQFSEIRKNHPAVSGRG